MIAAGKDIYCCMPQLSVYMGHCDPKDTEYYLRLTPTAFPELLAMDAKTTMPITEIVNLFYQNKKYKEMDTYKNFTRSLEAFFNNTSSKNVVQASKR